MSLFILISSCSLPVAWLLFRVDSGRFPCASPLFLHYIDWSIFFKFPVSMILDMRETQHAVKCYLCVILCLLLWQNSCLCINYSHICVNAVDHCYLSVVKWYWIWGCVSPESSIIVWSSRLCINTTKPDLWYWNCEAGRYIFCRLCKSVW